jgi:hypothetical protein
MRRIGRVALVSEVAVSFSLASLVLFMLWVPAFFINFGNEHQSVLQQLATAVPIVAGVAGIVGGLTLLLFILCQTRLLSRRALLACSLAGLVLSGWAATGLLMSETTRFLSIVPAAPFVCGLHLLYLGRSYFTAANKPMEPTR